MSQRQRNGLCVGRHVLFVVAFTQSLGACSSSEGEPNALQVQGGEPAVFLGTGGDAPLGLGGVSSFSIGSLGNGMVSGAATGVGGASTMSPMVTGGSKATGGVPNGGTSTLGGSKATGGSSGSCPETGHVTYTLAKETVPTSSQQSAYDKITFAMDDAVKYYNCYTRITKVLYVTYNPAVATADGNTNGSIRFGSTASMNRVTAMHEISHTVGIGTASNWSTFVLNKTFTGANANSQLLDIPNRLARTIGADGIHFWPYGLNYESEGGTEADLVAHCQMVTAIRKDLGLN